MYDIRGRDRAANAYDTRAEELEGFISVDSKLNNRTTREHECA